VSFKATPAAPAAGQTRRVPQRRRPADVHQPALTLADLLESAVLSGRPEPVVRPLPPPEAAPDVPEEELARLATLVLDAMGDGVDIRAEHRPHDARRALHLWGLLRWRGSDRARHAGAVDDWSRAVGLNDRQLPELVRIARTARALLR
jgi:hypothetical protein